MQCRLVVTDILGLPIVLTDQGTDRFFEMSLTIYQSMLRNIPEKGTSHIEVVITYLFVLLYIVLPVYLLSFLNILKIYYYCLLLFVRILIGS